MDFKLFLRRKIVRRRIMKMLPALMQKIANLKQEMREVPRKIGICEGLDFVSLKLSFLRKVPKSEKLRANLTELFT